MAYDLAIGGGSSDTSRGDASNSGVCARNYGEIYAQTTKQDVAERERAE